MNRFSDVMSKIKAALMENKFLTGMVLVFGALLIIAAYPNIKTYFDTKVNKSVDQSTVNFFTGYNKSNVSQITVSAAGKSVVLTKNASDWLVDGKKVMASKIETLFSSLENLKVGELVSKNAKNQTEMGIDDTIGTVLTLKNTTGEVKVVLGASGAQLGSFFIRKAGDNNVYLANGALRNAVFTSADEWRDKTLANVNFDLIYKVDIFGATNFSVIKNNDGKLYKSVWGNETELAADKLAALKGLFTPLIGETFLDETQLAEFNNAYKTNIKVLDKDGKVLTELNAYKKDDAYWVQAAGSEDVSVVASIGTLLEL